MYRHRAGSAAVAVGRRRRTVSRLASSSRDLDGLSFTRAACRAVIEQGRIVCLRTSPSTLRQQTESSRHSFTEQEHRKRHDPSTDRVGAHRSQVASARPVARRVAAFPARQPLTTVEQLLPEYRGRMVRLAREFSACRLSRPTDLMARRMTTRLHRRMARRRRRTATASSGSSPECGPRRAQRACTPGGLVRMRVRRHSTFAPTLPLQPSGTQCVAGGEFDKLDQDDAHTARHR